MYNKLFTKILDSSIWLETDATRIVWLTLIAAMDETGFVQFASVANLAHRARVSDEGATEAVSRLESPDKNSSDPDHEGRRIERVPGGWMILNAEKYRDLVTRAISQEKTRKRVADFRERQRGGYQDRIKAQSGKCDCCDHDFETPFNLYVVQDHNHKTGATRGLICQSCNKVVGLIEKGKATYSEKEQICKNYIIRWNGNGDVTAANVPVTPSEAFADIEASASLRAADKPPRARNELVDALAAVEGIPLAEISSAVGARLSKALSIIKETSPAVTSDEIMIRGGNLRLHHEGAACTAMALANHWGKCSAAPEGNGTRKRVPGPAWRDDK